MNPIGVAKYILFSAVFVVSLVAGLRLIFAHEVTREGWRNDLKRRVYISRPRFRLVTVSAGLLLLLLALLVALLQVRDLASDG